MQPHGFWPNFYQGLCAHRQGHFAESVAAFSVCIGAAPHAAASYYNRALGFTALGQSDLALRDYDHALRLDATLAGAALNRGMLHYEQQRYDAAEDDLLKARDLGGPLAAVYFNLALVQAARQDAPAALRSLEQVLDVAPDCEEALFLRDRLRSP